MVGIHFGSCCLMLWVALSRVFLHFGVPQTYWMTIIENSIYQNGVD